jgi:hypothetical protein
MECTKRGYKMTDAINSDGLDVAIEKPIECPAPKKRPKPERTIFRFKGAEDVAIDLGKIYKIVCKDKEKKVLLQMSPKPEDLSDAVEFESEEAAYRGYEQIIGAWAGNVLE